MGAVLGVEVLQIRQVLEVVGVHGAVIDDGVGHNVVIVDLNVQGDVLGGQDLLSDLQDLGVGRGGSGHGDGLALQRVIVHGGVIAVGGVLHHGDHRAGVPLSDEVGHLLALQSGLQSQGLGGGLAALLDGQDVGVSGGAALDQQGVIHGVQAGVDGVVAVDHGVVQIGQHIGQLGGLCLHDLHIVRILHDVVLGGGDAHAVLQLDDAVLLQQQQGAGFVGGVVGNTDLDDGSVGLVAAVVGLAAAGSQAQSQYSGQGQGDDLSQSVVFHVRSLL